MENNEIDDFVNGFVDKIYESWSYYDKDELIEMLMSFSKVFTTARIEHALKAQSELMTEMTKLTEENENLKKGYCQSVWEECKKFEEENKKLKKVDLELTQSEKDLEHSQQEVNMFKSILKEVEIETRGMGTHFSTTLYIKIMKIVGNE